MRNRDWLGDGYPAKCRCAVHDIFIRGMLFTVGVDATRIVDYHSVFGLKVSLHVLDSNSPLTHWLLLTDRAGREVAGDVREGGETGEHCVEGEIGDGSWVFLRRGWFGWKMVGDKESVAKATEDEDCDDIKNMEGMFWEGHMYIVILRLDLATT